MTDIYTPEYPASEQRLRKALQDELFYEWGESLDNLPEGNAVRYYQQRAAVLLDTLTQLEEINKQHWIAEMERPKR